MAGRKYHEMNEGLWNVTFYLSWLFKERRYLKELQNATH